MGTFFFKGALDWVKLYWGLYCQYSWCKCMYIYIYYDDDDDDDDINGFTASFGLPDHR